MNEYEHQQSEMLNSPSYLAYLQQNAAVEPDGIELDFQGDKCGHAYRIKRTCLKTWDSFFYDWREGGWVELRQYGGWHNRREAIECCNKHALEHRLINFLPTRPKFKPSALISGYAAAAAAAIGAISPIEKWPMP